MGQPEEAKAAASTEPFEDDPPPPYEESTTGGPPPLPARPKQNPFPYQPKPGPSSSSSPSTSSSGPVKLTRRFPHDLNMYYTKSAKNPTFFHLAEHEEQPLYAVTLSLDIAGKSSYLTLHSGPDPDSPALAVAETKRVGRITHRSLITVADPGSTTTTTTTTTTTEGLSAHASGLTSVSYSFSADVGRGGGGGGGQDLRREKFEWRTSRGGEVKNLDRGPGRKLVRLSTEADGVGGTRAVRDPGATSDGKEVVAVWADNARWRENRTGRFQFLGSGATGELGDGFAVLAVATALRIWELGNEASLGGAASSS